LETLVTDKRSTHTDALATLGTILANDDASAQRDAIHLAVLPVIAGQRLNAGQHICLINDKAYGAAKDVHNLVGIVDPFVKGPVCVGERFWLVVYPRQITSLRHVWSHPSFPDAQPLALTEAEGKRIATAVAEALTTGPQKKLLMDFADSIGVSYGRLMDAAEDYQERGEYLNLGDNEGVEICTGFWEAYEAVTGKVVAPDMKDSFFTCAC
jgi:hypothetical protein